MTPTRDQLSAEEVQRAREEQSEFEVIRFVRQMVKAQWEHAESMLLKRWSKFT